MKDGAGSYIVIATAIRPFYQPAHSKCDKILGTTSRLGNIKMSLFSLHRYILETSATLPYTPRIGNMTMMKQMHETSLDPLDAATRIMIDTSEDHVEYGVPHAFIRDIPPLWWL